MRRRALVAIAVLGAVTILGATLHAQEPQPVEEPTPGASVEEEMGELEGLDVLEGLGDLEGLDDTMPSDEDAGVRLSNFKGFVLSRFRAYFRDRDQGLQDEQWINELEFEFDIRLGSSLSGYFRPRFLIDALDDELKRTDPLELYLTYEQAKFDVRVGQFIENWGIADTFNPVDVLNRRDLIDDVLDFQRLGELGLRFRYLAEGGDTIGEPTFSLYCVPVFQEFLFPPSDSRWSFAQPPNRLFDDDSITPSGFDRVLLATRATGTLSTGPANADVQLLVTRGPDRFPAFTSMPNVGGGLDLTPIYYGIWTMGGGIRAVPNADGWSDYTLKAEVVYRKPYEFSGGVPSVLPDDYVQYAFGVDRLFPNVFSDADIVTATVEWVGETGASDQTALFRPFDDDLVLRGLWEANDFARTSVELRAVIDASSYEWVVEGILQRQLRSISEDLQLEIGIQYFEPDYGEPGFFALFPNNSNLRLGLRLDF